MLNKKGILLGPTNLWNDLKLIAVLSDFEHIKDNQSRMIPNRDAFISDPLYF
jgi:hypothetical protein